MVWFTKAKMVWTSKDSTTMIPEVYLTKGKWMWIVKEENQRPVIGEANHPIDAMNAAASYINSQITMRKDAAHAETIKAKGELNKQIWEHNYERTY